MLIGMSAAGAEKLRAAASGLRGYPKASARAGTKAVNDVAHATHAAASSDMVQRYNLPAAYIRAQFRTVPAKGENGTAIVKVGRQETRRARFGSKQVTVSAKRAKGDPRRGIPAGRKQAGVSYQYLRAGSRRTSDKAFFLPLRAGKVSGGNGFGMFERFGDKVEQLYGVAPYQVFDDWVIQHREQLQRSLVTSWRARLAGEIRRSGK